MFAPLGANEDNWVRTRNREGIELWRRPVQDTSLVEFKAITHIDAPILQLVAVIFAVNRDVEWLDGNDQSYDVEHLTSTSVVNYNRTNSPFWLVADRDVVMHVTLERVPGEKRLVCKFWSFDYLGRPPVPGVVRMPDVHGYFSIEQLSHDENEVTYQLFSDPGGLLPHWVANWAAEDMPYNTLRALRQQVRKPGYEKLQQQLRQALDWRQFDL